MARQVDQRAARPVAAPERSRLGGRLAASGNLGGAIYGTILATSILIGSRGGALQIFLAVIITGVVFWLAHAHSSLVMRMVNKERFPGRRDVRHALEHEWPLLQACLPPALPMLLAVAGIMGKERARDLGILVGLAALWIWGVAAARAAHLGRRGLAVVAGINVLLGVILVALKLLVVH